MTASHSSSDMFEQQSGSRVIPALFTTMSRPAQARRQWRTSSSAVALALMSPAHGYDFRGPWSRRS